MVVCGGLVGFILNCRFQDGRSVDGTGCCWLSEQAVVEQWQSVDGTGCCLNKLWWNSDSYDVSPPLTRVTRQKTYFSFS